MSSPTDGDVQACRVCGFRVDGYFPYGEDGRTPLWEHCTVCGVEHGYQDNNPVAARRFREQWLEAGARWQYADFDDDGLTTEQRLEQVPEEYR